MMYRMKYLWLIKIVYRSCGADVRNIFTVNFPERRKAQNCGVHFTGLSGRYSVLERPLSEMKRSFIPQSSFKSMARAKAGINAPLTGFQTVDYCNQAEQRIVLLMSIQ